ncbi:hypothetical protein [Methylocystis sp.]|uniref:hypothetical protein n=1 Tax=Methylocystis sp. TaxID=1911079 RepID=UPI0025ED10F5|nr:hypothetical protein [Methylocystis sp.]
MDLLTSHKVTYGATGAVALFIAAILFGGGFSFGAAIAAVVGFVIGLSAAFSE